MKATELMIGDYVQLNGSPYVIEEISKKGWVHMTDPVHNLRVQMSTDYILDFIEGVPLTVEILESNGFDLNGISEDLVPAEDRDFSDDTYVWQAGKFEDDTVVRVCVYFDYRYNDCIVELETPNITTDSIRLKYVHQLQHALRLCGIEKEIVLNPEP